MADRPQIALCQIEHGGKTYHYGDEVPDEVIEEHPQAVGDQPLTAGEVDKMSKADLQAALKRQSGLEDSNA